MVVFSRDKTRFLLVVFSPLGFLEVTTCVLAGLVFRIFCNLCFLCAVCVLVYVLNPCTLCYRSLSESSVWENTCVYDLWFFRGYYSLPRVLAYACFSIYCL